ncbi:MAG: DNA-packaging protein [Alphaproteobacteria bacterium]
MKGLHADWLASQPEIVREELVRSLTPDQAVSILHDWRFWARSNQLPPAGEWRVWLLLAGRGFGKTRTGAELVRARAISGSARRIAFVAPTASDARDVMVEGESGVLSISPPRERPRYEPSKRRLTWPNGAVATLFSADQPERLRGPQHDLAWCDELAAWRYPEAWDMLMLGLRLGRDPRAVVTTTPRPTSLVRTLLADPTVVVTRGRTAENRDNLAPAFLEQIIRRYRGTRLGRQELDGEILEDVPGALWSRAIIEAARASAAPELARIVVAIDPAAASGEQADETGIIVAGADAGGQGHVLADASGRYAPAEWARAAITAYRAHAADRVVAEVNNGGEMVEATLRMIDPNVPFRAVRAARGKTARAEPVAALYEQGRVRHVGAFPQLEDQMCAFVPGVRGGFDRGATGGSPDRVDALVWALTELLVEPRAGEGIFETYRRLAARENKVP